MKIGGLLRARFALTLALCAVLWSDPSFAALICRSPQCSLDAMRSRQPWPAAVRPAASTSRISDATPCCPRHARNPNGLPDELSCCNIDRAASLTQALSERPGTNRLGMAAVQRFPATSSLRHSPLPDARSEAPYLKPVDQKKTDLRI